MLHQLRGRCRRDARCAGGVLGDGKGRTPKSNARCAATTKPRIHRGARRLHCCPLQVEETRAVKEDCEKFNTPPSRLPELPKPALQQLPPTK